MSLHDPFENRSLAHPRAKELMLEGFFWDVGDELGPFGSDEGWDAYYEWRDWRSAAPNKSLLKCLKWILGDKLSQYTANLCSDVALSEVKLDDLGFGSAYSLDITIISTCFGQLIDEGVIESSVVPYLQVALTRQLKSCEKVEEQDEFRAGYTKNLKAMFRVLNESQIVAVEPDSHEQIDLF